MTSTAATLTGNVFSLARWFQAPVNANGADEEIGEDGMDTRERILSDLYRATAIAIHDDGTVLAITPNGAAMIEKKDVDGCALVVFEYVRNDRWGKTQFWMNASSVKGLGDYLRSLPRRPFDALFVGAED